MNAFVAGPASLDGFHSNRAILLAEGTFHVDNGHMQHLRWYVLALISGFEAYLCNDSFDDACPRMLQQKNWTP